MGRLLSGGYFPATRHPWSCIVFVLPLLLAYEIGLYVAGPGQPEVLRNGADAWLRMGLAHLGLRASYWAPVLLVIILILWSVFHRGNRPESLIATFIGMTAESALYAVGLWTMSRALWPLLAVLSTGPGTSALEPAMPRIVSFIGAGVYEEALFRLLIFSGLFWVLRLADLPTLVCGLAAAIASALLFAAAHHLGPNGEAFSRYIFVFRAIAGLYFTALFYLRGFGVAVGTHAGYDVLVGVLVAPGP